MKRKIFRKYFLAGVLFTLIFTFVNSPWAAEKKYPSGSIDMFCGYVPGGPSDLLNRAVAKGFEKYLGVPVIPGNKPGGGSIVAASALANSRPDGYTLAILVDSSMLTAIALGQATFSLEDFRIVGQTAIFFNVLCVSADSEWKTFQQFLDYTRKNPGVKYGHPGLGSAIFLRTENVNKYAGMGMVGVPFKGDTEIVAALLGKHVPVGVSVLTNFKPHVDEGKLRILLSFEPPALMGLDPNIPTVETVFGKDVGDIDVPFSLIAPAKTPDDIIKTLEQTLQKVVKDPEFVSTLKRVYLVPSFVDGKTVMEKQLPDKMAKIKSILKKVGMIK
jgi:tripartite-type tricarboxylate transporter receptor subunit TctC